jgi:hypothetical protein
VLDLAAVGGGCPDLLVGRAGKNYLIEIKDGAKPASARKLNAAQANFHAAWRGHPVRVVVDVETALEAVGVVPGSTTRSTGALRKLR